MPYYDSVFLSEVFQILDKACIAYILAGGYLWT